MTLQSIKITRVCLVFDTGHTAEVVTKDDSRKAVEIPRMKAETKKRRTRALFNDQQKADIIARYKAGEGPKAIAESLGCHRSTITHLITQAGVAEGRTGAHLAEQNKKRAKAKQPEPEPEPV